MKRRMIFTVLILAAVCIEIQGQNTLRQRDWPVGVPMNEETIEWRQDVYREIDLTHRQNMGLYSPSYQEEGTVGLFAKIFELAVQKKIHLYKFVIEGNEQMTKGNRTEIENILEDYHIGFSKEDSILKVDKNDVPYADVTMFYLKEASYYDAVNSSFATRVLAVCPVILMEDEFSDEIVRYPLFWVDYQELEKYLHAVEMVTGGHNLAKTMPMDEFFALTLYEGKIYKNNNFEETVTGQGVRNDSTAREVENRIDSNRRQLRNVTYNTYYEDDKDKFEEKQREKKRKHLWIFPWQKQKMKDAMKKELEEEKAG